MSQNVVPVSSMGAIVGALDKAQSNLGLLEAANMQNSTDAMNKMSSLSNTSGIVTDVVKWTGMAVAVLDGVVGVLTPLAGMSTKASDMFKGLPLTGNLKNIFDSLALGSIILDEAVKLFATLPNAVLEMSQAAEKSMDQVAGGYRSSGMDVQRVLQGDQQAINAALSYIGAADTV